MLRVSLRNDFYMTQKDQVFIADVVVTDMTWEIVALNVINRPTGAIVEFNVITKTCKYKWFHEGFYSNGHGGAQHTQV